MLSKYLIDSKNGHSLGPTASFAAKTFVDFCLTVNTNKFTLLNLTHFAPSKLTLQIFGRSICSFFFLFPSRKFNPTQLSRITTCLIKLASKGMPPLLGASWQSLDNLKEWNGNTAVSGQTNKQVVVQRDSSPLRAAHVIQQANSEISKQLDVF